MKITVPTAIIALSTALVFGQGNPTTDNAKPLPKVAAPVSEKGPSKSTQKKFVRKRSSTKSGSIKVISPMSFQLIMGDSIDVVGYAPPQAIILIEGVQTTANIQGVWEVRLPTPQTPGSQWMKVKAVSGVDTLRQHIVYTKASREQEKKPELIAKAKKQVQQAKRKVQTLKKKQNTGKAFVHYKRPETVYSIGIFDFLIDSTTYVVPAHYGRYIDEALIGNEFFGVKPLPEQKPMCKEYECAVEMVQSSGFDFFVLGKVARKDSVTVLAVELFDSYSDESIDQFTFEYTAFKNFDTNMKNLSEMVANKLYSLIENVGQDLEESKWETLVFEPYTDHLKGTRIETIMPDTLKKSESPYIIRTTLEVPVGKVLTIEPGVQIYFGGQNTNLIIKGQVVAIGTKDEPIRIHSGRDIPRNDDWGKMIFANSQGNIFTWLEMGHAENGFQFINSSATLQNAIIRDTKNNSIHVQSSDISIYDSDIAGGALVGLLVDEYATVSVERSRIFNSVNAVAVRSMGSLSMKSTLVENSEKGMLLLGDISLTMNKVRIRKNEYGVISSKKIDLDNFDFNKNEVNFKLLDEPVIEDVIARAKYGKDTTQSLVVGVVKAVEKGLKLGIYSIKEKTELNILGNLGLGIEYNQVTHEKVPGPKVFVAANGDTIGVGSNYPNDKLQDGIAYNFSVYSSLDYGNFVLEYSMDGRYDDWIADSDVKSITYIDPLSLKMGTKNHTLQIGDFNEVGGELSFAGRDIWGGKYYGKFGGDEYNKPVVAFTAVYGEAQRPLDIGDKNPEAFNEIIETNNAYTQEMLLYAQMEIYTSNYSSLTFGWVQSENNRSGFYLGRDDLAESSGLYDPERKSRSGYWRGHWTNPKGTFEVNAEIAYGLSDTLNGNIINGTSNFVTELKAAYSIDSTLTTEQIVTLDSLHQIISDSLSAYPVIRDTDKFTALLNQNGQPFYGMDVDSLYADYVTRASTEDEGGEWYDQLKNNMAYMVEAEYFFPQSSVALGAKIVTPYFYSPGSGTSVSANSRNYFGSYSHTIQNNWNAGIEYNLDINNVGTKGDLNLFGFAEGSFMGLQEGKDFKANENRPLYIHDIVLTSDYRLNDQWSFDIEYGINYQTQKDSTTQIVRSDDDIVYTDPFFKGSGGATDTTRLYYGQTLSINKERYYGYLAAEEVLQHDFESKDLTHSVALGSKFDLNSMNQLKLGADLELLFDKSEFANTSDNFYTTASDTLPIALSNETLRELGYYLGGEDKVKYSFPFEYSLKYRPLRFNNRFKVTPIFTSIVKDNEAITEIKVSNKISMKVLDRRVTLTLDVGMKTKTTEEDAVRYYVIDTLNTTTAVKLYHTEGDGTYTATETATSDQVSAKPTALPTNSDVRIEEYRSTEEELDWWVSFVGRYNLTSRMYLEGMVRYDTFERPQQLESQYSHFYTALNYQYSF
ncbi:MAG: hypothetical protein OCD01_00875 [Fibrobacterales bacterium]